MAIIKFISVLHPTSKQTLGNLKNCIDYITNEKKTENQILVGTQNCVKGHVLEDMADTMSAYGKLNLDNVHSRLGYHFCISFKKGEKVSGNAAINVVKEFCEKHIPGYEAVYSVHTDKKHIHCHICFNSVSYLTGQKYRYEDGDWAKTIQPLLDEICLKNNIPTLEQDCGIPIEEYEKDRKTRKRKKADGTHNNSDYVPADNTVSYSRNEMIKNDIDEAIIRSNNFEEFLYLMKERGYQIKQGKNIKHMAVKAPGDNQYRRIHQLDKETGLYSEEKIRERISRKEAVIIPEPINSDYRYILPERFRYIPKHFKQLDATEKRYYAKMYRLGMAKKKYRISYQEIKRNMREINEIRAKLSLLDNYTGIDGLSEKLEDTKLKKEKCINEISKTKHFQKSLKKLFNGEGQTDSAELLQREKELKAGLNKLKKELREETECERLLRSIIEEMNGDTEDLTEIYEEILKEENAREKEERNKNNESVRNTGKKRTI